jgi:RNA polymerase sigma-70 factor (ECF subfamily)
MADIGGQTIEALRRGEDEAFTLVVDALLGPVYRFLLRLSASSSTAEDLTQETFLAVWRNVNSFEGRSQFRTWVFGIAYRQYLRFREKPKLETVQLDGASDEADGTDPAELLLESEHRQRVREAVLRLPAIYREVLCTVHLEGMTYKDAAAILGLPIGTVKSRMHVALTLLRETLRGSEGENDGVREAESCSL